MSDAEDVIGMAEEIAVVSEDCECECMLLVCVFVFYHLLLYCKKSQRIEFNGRSVCGLDLIIC